MTIATILAAKGSDVVTIAPDAPVAAAIARLAERNIGALVVVDATGTPCGILSERDVVRALASGRPLGGLAVADLMTRDLVVGTPEDEIAAVARTMTERRIRHLPVVHRGRLAGIVSIGDVLKSERDTYRGQADTLEAQILGEAR